MRVPKSPITDRYTMTLQENQKQGMIVKLTMIHLPMILIKLFVSPVFADFCQFHHFSSIISAKQSNELALIKHFWSLERCKTY